MVAAALTARLARLPARRSLAANGDATLAFHSTGGPLVAVCGLVGGAGTSTLAYLLARRAARHSTAPVLLAELEEQGGLATLAGAGGTLGLRELARAVDEGRTPARPFTELQGGLRLVAASRPAVAEYRATAALPRVLADARERHGLVVVDAGTLPRPDSATLFENATHILFLVSATVAALHRVEPLARAGIFRRAAGRCAALVAVATNGGRSLPRKHLHLLARRHVDRLLLVPHVHELATGQHDHTDAQLENTFAALTTLLRRTR